MKKILAIAKKDAIVRFASKSEWLFFLILPVVFTFLLAGGTPSGDQDPRIPLLVADEAHTPISRQLIDELESSTAIRPEVTTRQDAQKSVRRAAGDDCLHHPRRVGSSSSAEWFCAGGTSAAAE